MGTTGQSITLANSIIGVGILAMPYCFQQCGVLLATIILLSMGLMSRLCCYFLLKSALLARRRNFEFLAFHVFGSAGKMAVELGIIGFLMGTCIAYFVVVGDLGPQIIAKMFNINQSDILRTSIMVIVSLVCVLPLGLLRNVDSLSNVSAATICFYFCLVMKVIAEAASQLLTGDWHRRMEMWKPSGMLQCVPIISMALFCQTQLFEIFESLPSLSLEKMNVVTKNAINICTCVYLTLGVFGYIAFCSQNISGNILMSLSPTMASDVIKLGFVMSVAFSFPLIIFPCRASLYSFLYKKVHSSQHDHIINHSIPETTFRCITVAIIAVALFISLLIPNIELVLGLVGSTIGVLICVVFPAACFVNLTFKNTNERVLAKGVLVLGLIIMVLGTYANLQAAESKLDRYDDKYITQERIDKIVEDFFEREKSAEAVLKPLAKQDSDPIPIDEHLNKKAMVDSEVQPPNPVPPESQSNEKNQDTNIDQVNNDKVLKEVLPLEDSKVDKVSEIHPRNLKTKLNGAGLTSNEGNVEKKPDIPKEVKQPSNEDLSKEANLIKQQQLIETIKQHGEEQKELIKEQKEILDEIIKTKKELQQNKNEVDSNEAKKIAVESIKQIANMAIQSIGGVTEEPAGPQIDEVKAERLEKLTNEAVQEIAKKAVETIEAMQDIKENPDKPAVKSENNPVNIPNSNLSNVKPNNLVNPVASQPNNIIKTVTAQNNDQANKIIQSSVQNPNSQQVIPNINNMDSVNAKPEIQNNTANINSQPKTGVESINNKEKVEIKNAKETVNNLSQNGQPNSINENIKQENPLNQIVKVHSHSPDEPQSYKEGEDLLVKKPPDTKLNNVIQNVPLALAMNNIQSKEAMHVENVNNKQVDINALKENVIANNVDIKNNGAKEIPKNNVQPNNPVRQKREVVDCTHKVDLEPADKKICENLVAGPRFEKDSQEILPRVDLNKVGLSRNLPHHISRSLKALEDTDNSSR